MSKIISSPLIVVALSIAYLAYSLLAFMQEVTRTRQQLPYLFEQVERLEQGMRIESWLEFSKQLDKQIPVILQEIAEVRKTIEVVNQHLPAILAESKSMRETTVPRILAEVEAVRTKTIPPVLTEVQILRTHTIPSVLAEVQSVQKQIIPPVVNEVTALREEAPLIIARLEQLVADAESASAKASTGAVKGIITSPLSILEDSGKFVVNGAESLVGNKKN